MSHSEPRAVQSSLNCAVSTLPAAHSPQMAHLDACQELASLVTRLEVGKVKDSKTWLPVPGNAGKLTAVQAF